jgi:hypothetical protein
VLLVDSLIAGILWAGFLLLIVTAAAGVLLGRQHHRAAALALLLVSALGLLAFSEIAGFSIGRMTALIPVLISAHIVGMGRGKTTVGACLIGATLLYVAFSWLLTPVASSGGIWSAVFGSWGILLYAILSMVAFGWSVSRPPKRA